MTDAVTEPMKGSLGELAMMPGMPSEPTLKKLMAEHPAFPVLSRGKNGVAYEIDLAAAHQFVTAIRDAEELSARSRAAVVHQLGLELMGGQSLAGPSDAGLTASDRKAMIEAEILANRLGKDRGELVSKASMEAAIAAVFQLLNGKYRSFGARLSKRLELSREHIVMIDQIAERDLIELAKKFEEMGGTGDATFDVPDDPAV